MPRRETFLRDVIEIKEDVHAGDFKVELSEGFSEADRRVAEYVVTDQLRDAFGQALRLVGAAVRNGKPYTAYLHGSFGAGKSHFLTVLHAVLDNHPAARAKPKLQEVVLEHDEWLRRSRFLMVPYHLVGSADLDSALLGGYAHTVRALHPQAPVPAVYRSDALLADAARQRGFLGDDAGFLRWLGEGAGAVAPSGVPTAAPDGDDLDTGALEDEAPPPGTWAPADVDRAFAAPTGDPYREALVSALLSGPMASYARGARGWQDSFVPLENGLAVISRHARSLGYDGIVLFLDELVLWLQAHMNDQDFVRKQVQLLAKLIESGDSDRPVPIVSFISRQRDLSQLIGADVAGAEQVNLEQQIEYLAGRFEVIDLEDSNLVEIIKHRVLAPKPGMEQARDRAFAMVSSSGDDVRQVLLDAQGRTEATWDDFRTVYPLSPALLNVLVDLSGALQRERTGLKLVQELLRRRRDDLRPGDLIPLGDLWDLVGTRSSEAFTGRLRKESEVAHRFHQRVRAYLAKQYGAEDDPQFRRDDRIVKTLLLAALAPNVPALTRLTGTRIAALNHGTIRNRVGSPGATVVKVLRGLQAEFGELRSEGDSDPVFYLHLSDLDVGPILDEVRSADTPGARRLWIKDRLWRALGVGDTDSLTSQREIVWRGTRRTAEFVFGNVCDRGLLDEAFEPSADGQLRFVVDYPFDDRQRPPMDAVQRVHRLKAGGLAVPTVVWLPDYLSEHRAAQLGRLMRIDYLLERNRLDDHTATRSADERVQIRNQLKVLSESLTSQLTAVLHQLYGLSKPDPANVGAAHHDGQHVWSLEPAYPEPRLRPGASFEENLYTLADGLLDSLHPKHPDFDPGRTRKAVTPRELKVTHEWVNRAMEDGSRRVVIDSHQLATVRKVVHALGIGEVHDGPLTLGLDLRMRINQRAALAKAGPDIAVEDVRRWIADLGATGLDRLVGNLLIATYALLDDRTWVYQGGPLPHAPELDRIGPGYGLRGTELPGAEEFAAARERAGRIFGVPSSPVLFARNVARLAEGVRSRARAAQEAVASVRSLLKQHGAVLGITGDAPRSRSTRAAADLLARMDRGTEPAELVRSLAAARYDVTDEELAVAISHAPELRDGLEAVNWRLLASVRAFAGRGDSVGDRAGRLTARLAEAAGDHEQARSLVPVLNRLQEQTLDLVNEAAELAALTTPVHPVPRSGGPAASPGTPAPAADDISLTVHGSPAVGSGVPPRPRTGGPLRSERDEQDEQEGHRPGQPGQERAADPAARDGAARDRAARPYTSHVVEPSRLEGHLAAAVTEITAEIRAYVAEHPGTRVELVWRPVGAGEDER